MVGGWLRTQSQTKPTYMYSYFWQYTVETLILKQKLTTYHVIAPFCVPPVAPVRRNTGRSDCQYSLQLSVVMNSRLAVYPPDISFPDLDHTPRCYFSPPRRRIHLGSSRSGRWWLYSVRPSALFWQSRQGNVSPQQGPAASPLYDLPPSPWYLPPVTDVHRDSHRALSKQSSHNNIQFFLPVWLSYDGITVTYDQI